jgi:hypothetical protein
VGDGYFTGESGGMMGGKEWEVFFEEGVRPILNDLVWPGLWTGEGVAFNLKRRALSWHTKSDFTTDCHDLEGKN